MQKWDYLPMKKSIAFLLLLVVLAGCSQAALEPVSRLADWLEAADLYAEQTADELYAAALGEDMLIIYSTTTRMMDVAASFERQYPGLIVQVVHLREPELYDTLVHNYETGSFLGDLIISADGRGIMTGELLDSLIAVKYVPFDIAGSIMPGNNEALLMFAGEASVICYNELYYSEPPVSNWWELTEEKWRGMVYFASPTRSMTTLAALCMIIDNSDRMAQAYEDLHGRPLDLPPGESAGREFVRRLIANDAVIVNSSDEVAEIVGAPGSHSPYIGIVVSSKMRLRGIGYEFMFNYGMEPFVGVYTPISVMMAGGARNVNVAKLFIRWLLGEADGQGVGYQPYLQSGAWSVRSDVSDDTGIRSGDLNLLHLDRAFLYENYETFLAFWDEILEGS